MTEVRIEVGRTDGYRYIGVQPPLTEEQSDSLRAARYSDLDIPDRFGVQTPHKGEPFSESGTAVSLPGEAADQKVIESAEKVAHVLRHIDGDTVVLNRNIQFIGRGRFLFGGKAEKLV